MRRDWDTIRDVLLEVEALGDVERISFAYRMSDGDSVRAAHALMLHEAGYLKGVLLPAFDDGGGVLAPDLAWSGRDLLDTLRSRPLWDRIKSTAKDKGLELTFDVVKALATAIVPKIVGG